MDTFKIVCRYLLSFVVIYAGLSVGGGGVGADQLGGLVLSSIGLIMLYITLSK